MGEAALPEEGEKQVGSRHGGGKVRERTLGEFKTAKKVPYRS